MDLNVPRGRKLKIKAPPDVTQTVRDEGDRRIYHWSTSTLKYSTQADLLKQFRFNVTTLLEGVRPEPPRQIVFSTFESWGEIGKWYSQLEEDRRAVTPEIRAQADTITKGESSDAGKAEALYRWVAENIRYVSLSFGLGRYQPHAASEVLTNRYGDCKDKSTLLEAMLQAEGMHADPVLVNSTRDIDPDVPTPQQFDHVITLLSLDGKKVWLDSTTGVGPFGYLLPQLRGKNALVASASASELEMTPSDLAIPTIYKLEVKENPESGDTRSVHFALDTRGDLEVLLRLGFMQLPVAQMTEMLNRGAQQANNATGSNVSFRDVKTSDPLDTRQPFRLEATLSETGRGSANTDELTKDLPAIRSLVNSILPEPRQAGGNAGGAQPNIQLKAPEEFSLTLVIPLPSAPGNAASKPESSHMATNFAVFDDSAQWDGTALRATWHLKIVSSEVPSSRSGEYEEFRRSVLSALNTASPVVAYLFEARIMTNPHDGNAYLTLGDSYLAGHEYEAAVTNLEKAAGLLPFSEPAELSLARAYLGAGQDDKAVATFKQMIAMDRSANTLNNAAYFLGDKSTHMHLAEKWAKSAVTQVENELNRSDLGSIQTRSAQLTGSLAADWDTLGWIKFREGDLSGAEKYIHAAWVIANYTDVGYHLGTVYEALNRKDEAIEAYTQTLALVPDSRSLSDDERAAKRNLASLLGGDSLADERVQQARADFHSRRSIQVDNPNHLTGSGRFILIIGSGSKVEAIRAVDRNSPVNQLGPEVQSASMPQPFPDGTLQKMPRAGRISCPGADRACTFTLLPPVPAARVFESARSD